MSVCHPIQEPDLNEIRQWYNGVSKPSSEVLQTFAIDNDKIKHKFAAMAMKYFMWSRLPVRFNANDVELFHVQFRVSEDVSVQPFSIPQGNWAWFLLSKSAHLFGGQFLTIQSDRILGKIEFKEEHILVCSEAVQLELQPIEVTTHGIGMLEMIGLKMPGIQALSA